MGTLGWIGRLGVMGLVTAAVSLRAESADAACAKPPYAAKGPDTRFLEMVCGKTKRSGFSSIAKYYIDRAGMHEDDWDSTNYGWGKECDATMPVGRMLGSISLIENSYKDKAPDWNDKSPPLVRSMYGFMLGGLDELDDLRAGGCKDYPAEEFDGYFQIDRIELYMGLFAENIVFRAGTLIHETHHYRRSTSHACEDGDKDNSFYFQRACPRCPVVPPPQPTTYGIEGAWYLSYFNKADDNTSTSILASMLEHGESRLLDSLCSSSDVPQWMKDVMRTDARVTVTEGQLL